MRRICDMKSIMCIVCVSIFIMYATASAYSLVYRDEAAVQWMVIFDEGYHTMFDDMGLTVGSTVCFQFEYDSGAPPIDESYWPDSRVREYDASRLKRLIVEGVQYEIKTDDNRYYTRLFDADNGVPSGYTDYLRFTWQLDSAQGTTAKPCLRLIEPDDSGKISLGLHDNDREASDSFELPEPISTIPYDLRRMIGLVICGLYGIVCIGYGVWLF